MNIKKSIGLCLVMLLQSWETYAGNAPNDIFVHLDTGVSLSGNLKGGYKNNINNSAIFGAGLKYSLFPKIKVGTSFAYRPGYEYKYTIIASPTQSVQAMQKFNITSFMINASYDIFTIKDKVTPYIEVGGGFSRIYQGSYSLGTSTSNGKISNNFIMNGGVGVAFEISRNMNIDVNYKYTDFRKIKQLISVGTDSEVDSGRISANEFMISLRFKI